LGQSAPYDQVETNPEIEFTIEKVIDGYPFLYHMATSGANSNTLDARLKQRCNVAMAIGSDESTSINPSGGLPRVEIYMSGMYVNGITYTFSADGNATESVTLVGNNKTWNALIPFDNKEAGHKAGAMTGWTTNVVNAIDDRIAGSDVIYPKVTISFIESIEGTFRDIKYKRQVRCTDCKGKKVK